MSAKSRRNPFYVLLVPVGVAFVVTAFAYGVMAFQAVDGSPVAAAAQYRAHPLLEWMREYGDAAMMLQLGILAGLTVAAIATDRLWDRPTRPDRFTRE